MKKYYYAEQNRFGVNLTYGSIGWKVYRFATKAERDNYVDKYKWNGCNRVIARIKAKNIHKIIGHGGKYKTLEVFESWTDKATGARVEVIQYAW